MSVPVCPLGDLAGYSLSTLQELADQHLDRADEMRRKLDGVVERHESIVNAIGKKTMKKNTVSYIRQLLSDFPDEARADIFSVVKLENGDIDDVQVHEWSPASRVDGKFLRLLAKPDSWTKDGPAVSRTVGTIRLGLAQMDDDDLVTIGFSSDYGEDCPVVDFHSGWAIDDIDDGDEPFVCLEIVRITLAATVVTETVSSDSAADAACEICEICGNTVSFDDAETLEIVKDLMQVPVHAACIALSPEECLKRFQLRFVGVKMETAQALVRGALLARYA